MLIALIDKIQAMIKDFQVERPYFHFRFLDSQFLYLAFVIGILSVVLQILDFRVHAKDLSLIGGSLQVAIVKRQSHELQISWKTGNFFAVKLDIGIPG